MREPRTDPYRVLGVSRDATAADITRAYRRLARAVHPDTAPPEAGAAARFRAVAEAYEVLSDPARRAGYDRAAYRQVAPGHAAHLPAARPGPAAWPQPAGPRIPADPGPVRAPALWAGPVRVEPPLLPGAPGARHVAGSQAGAAGWASLLRWYLSTGQDGLW